MSGEKETWVEICDGFYEVSSEGNIRRAKPGIATFVGRPVSPVLSGNGYPVVAVRWAEGKQVRRYLHHLVAAAFHGERPEGCVINHIDGDKMNNAASNLEYVSRKENAAHALRCLPRVKGPTKPKAAPKGLAKGDNHWTRTMPDRIARGGRMPHTKITETEVKAIRDRAAKGEKQRLIADDYGLSFSQTNRIIKETRWSYVK